MKKVPKRRRIGAITGAMALITLSASCENADRPTAVDSRTAVPSTSFQATSYSSSDWNYYTAEVTISSSGGYEGFDRPDSYRATGYRTERTLGANGVWATVVTFASNEPFGPPPAGAVYDVDIARIETDDMGSYHRVYDRSGALVDGTFSELATPLWQGAPPVTPQGAQPRPEWPTPPAERPPPDCTPDYPCEPIQPAMSVAGAPASGSAVRTDGAGAAGSAAAAVGRGDSRNWLDRTVVTPAARVRTLAFLRSRFGVPAGRVNGLQRFVRVRGSRTSEVLLDSVSGTILEENLAEGGELRVRTTHSYQQVEPGVFVRRQSRIEIAPLRGGALPAVIVTNIANVKVGVVANPGGAR